MFIAQQKKKENIAEYVLYMWHVEDILRSFNHDIRKISQFIIKKHDISRDEKAEMHNWYSDLIEMAEVENVKKTGHLQIIKNITGDITDLHLTLLKLPEHEKYRTIYATALPHIQELEKKLSGTTENEVEVCLSGLYGIMMIRMKQKEVGQETLEAAKTFSTMLAYLSDMYAKREAKPDDFFL